MAAMMSLGGYRFSIGTAAYQQLEQKTSYRWESQARLGRHPAMQFLGEGHREIVLRGVILPRYRGGLGQMESLRAMAGRGAPMPLISGYGKVFGLFSVMEIADVQTVFRDRGIPLKMEFTVTMQSYGADGGGLF